MTKEEKISLLNKISDSNETVFLSFRTERMNMCMGNLFIEWIDDEHEYAIKDMISLDNDSTFNAKFFIDDIEITPTDFEDYDNWRIEVI